MSATFRQMKRISEVCFVLADFPAVFFHICGFDICHETQQAVATPYRRGKIFEPPFRPEMSNSSHFFCKISLPYTFSPTKTCFHPPWSPPEQSGTSSLRLMALAWNEEQHSPEMRSSLFQLDFSTGKWRRSNSGYREPMAIIRKWGQSTSEDGHVGRKRSERTFTERD